MLCESDQVPRRPIAGSVMPADAPAVKLAFGCLHVHGVRLETGYAEGQFVTPFYDPMLAKIIVHGLTRAHAIGRALVALRGVEVAGVATNVPLLAAVLESDAFVAGNVHTRFLDTFEW